MCEENKMEETSYIFNKIEIWYIGIHLLHRIDFKLHSFYFVLFVVLIPLSLQVFPIQKYYFLPRFTSAWHCKTKVTHITATESTTSSPLNGAALWAICFCVDDDSEEYHYRGIWVAPWASLHSWVGLVWDDVPRSPGQRELEWQREGGGSLDRSDWWWVQTL